MGLRGNVEGEYEGKGEDLWMSRGAVVFVVSFVR